MNISSRNGFAASFVILMLSTVSIIAVASENGVFDLPVVVPESLLVSGVGCTPSELFTDGTFESGTPWPAWTIQTSDVFGTPLCDIDTCGVGGGSASPFAGDNWAWFGGVPVTEMATLGRSVIIPSGGTASLTFQMRIGAVNAPFTDVLRIKVDGNIVQTYTEPAISEAAYSLRTVNLNAFANGSSHTILFEYIHTDAGVANFTIDNVSLVAGGCPAPVVNGRITYENAAVPVVPVPYTNLAASGSPKVFATSDMQGNYAMTGFGTGPYTVVPTKADVFSTTPNGIFSNDAALISRYVVGLTTLNSTQLKAAAVAGLPAITSFDAGLVAQWIVGIPNPVSRVGMWEFTPTTRNYPAITSNQVNQDYAALLLGDVTGDWVAPTMTHPRPFGRIAILASVPQEMKGVQTGYLTVPLRLDGLAGTEVSSFQFDIEFDSRVIQPAQLAANIRGTISDGLTIISNSPHPGSLKVVVYGATPVSGDGVYVELRFLARGEAESFTDIKIKSFRINNGKDEVITADGRLTLHKQ